MEKYSPVDVFNIEKPEMGLIVLDDLKPSKHLRRSYIWSKKLKITILIPEEIPEKIAHL